MSAADGMASYQRHVPICPFGLFCYNVISKLLNSHSTVLCSEFQWSFNRLNAYPKLSMLVYLLVYAGCRVAVGLPHTFVVRADAAATQGHGRRLLALGCPRTLLHRRNVGCCRQRRCKAYYTSTVCHVTRSGSVYRVKSCTVVFLGGNFLWWRLFAGEGRQHN